MLPQTAQMQSFTFAPPTLAPRENQRSELRAPPQPPEVEGLADTAEQTMSSLTSTTGTNASKVCIVHAMRSTLLT